MRIIAFAAAMSVVALPALAWQPSPIDQGRGVNAATSPASDSGSAAGAAAAASARASSRSAAVAKGGAGGTASVTNNVSAGNGVGGSGDYIGTFATPSLSTANTCAAGISLGGFGSGGGGGGAAQWELHDCRLRTEAAMLDARGDHAAARNVWCQISEVKTAYEQAGEPCPDGKAKVQPVAAGPATTVVVHKDEVPDWCFTTTARDPAADRSVCNQRLNTAMNHLKDQH